MHEVTAEERFLFDIQGFLILRGAIDRGLIDALDAAVVENEAKDHDESWANRTTEATIRQAGSVFSTSS